MTNKSELDSRKISIKQLFAIFLKTGKKRITLSIISGALVFLTITSLIMVVYTHRFKEFQEFESDYYDWFNDGLHSVSTNFVEGSPIILENDSFTQFVDSFRSLVNDIAPDIKTDNYTAAISTQVYTFNLSLQIEPFNHEFLVFDNRSYQVIADNVVEGRLPQNRTELLCFRRAESVISLNETIELYTIDQRSSPKTNYTIVGIIDENIRDALTNAKLSSDIVDWYFDDLFTYYNYPPCNSFFMNYSQFQEIFNHTAGYYGVNTYLMDISYDASALNLNKISTFVNNFPDASERILSELFGSEVIVAPDLYVMLSDYANLWVFKTIKILSFNSPLFFLIGLLLVIALTIGSKGLETSFRRMKLYGLNYNIIRRLLLFENLIFTFVSFLIGTLIGFGTSVLFTYNLENRPVNFYSSFVVEPLLIISLSAFTIGFFLLSFFIQNSIAKRTTKTAQEEFQQKRQRIRSIFSSSEFRMFVIGLLFTVFSISFYSIYRFWGTRFVYTTTFTYFTFMWFMISCSIAFLMTFIFLLLARLLTFLWSAISQGLWKNKLNLFSLTIKHISVNKGNYQIAILGALFFGLVVIPGLTIDKSINFHLQSESELIMGSTTLVIPHWVDPDDEFDYLLTNITEIEGFTEVTIYEITDDDLEVFTKAFQITLVGLEDPRNFTKIIDTTLINETKLSVEDIIALENDSKILLDKKHAKDYNIKPGDFYQTDHFTQYNNNLTLVNTYEYFPLMPLPRKPIFTGFLDVFTIVCNRQTIRDIAGTIYLDTDIKTENMKLIKPVNESVIPSVRQQLADLNYTTLSYDEVFENLYSQINDFAKNNLRFFVLLSSLSIIFIGFYTGVSIFEERGRIMDSFYRSGAVRRQILGIFSIEIILINSIPILITMITSLPLIQYIASYYLYLQSFYYPFKPGISWWLILLLFLAGITLSLIGWFIALVPAIYRYRPEKQE
ncbi:MAG: ABC transporter permease [Asgard group archaeon]|nr:ABC transporter permease [Asgard group archaeon]